jgi:hypothetical protein
VPESAAISTVKVKVTKQTSARAVRAVNMLLAASVNRFIDFPGDSGQNESRNCKANGLAVPAISTNAFGEERLISCQVKSGRGGAGTIQSAASSFARAIPHIKNVETLSEPGAGASERGTDRSLILGIGSV